MLWACLHFSDLPLRAVFDDSEQTLPCAVVDGPLQRQQIVFLNAQAGRSGVRAGRVLAAARAVCASLQARTRDPAGENRLLLSLAAWAYRFSSHVSVSEPNALLIEVGASLRLFGGWSALEHRLRRELAAIGYAPALAVATVPAAARVLAAQHDGFFTEQREPMLAALGHVALAHSGLGSAAISLLYNVGCRTLREAFVLPRPELARRIGPDQLAMLDRLRGIEHEILPLYQPPDRFEHRVEFDYRVDAWPPLLFPLRRLCGELALFLTARDGGVQRCELKLEHEGHPATRVMIELLTPQREAKTLYDLIRSRLERIALDHTVCGMALVAADLPEFQPRHQDLFEPQRAQGMEWAELAERLRAHLGDDAVHRLATAADHRPEHAWRFAVENCGGLSRSFSPLPLAGEVAPQARVRVAHEAALPGTLPRPGIPTLAPALSRHREKVGKTVVSSCQQEKGKSGTPLHIRHRPLWLLRRALPLRGPAPRILAGPERIESGWWDGADARRDYYVVQTRNGQRAWAYLLPGATDGWMLHGWFA
jgi:protein ImuB